MPESKPELRHVAEQLARLIEVSITLNSTLNLDELLQFIIRTAAEILDCEWVSILLNDEKHRQLVFAAATGAEPGQLADIPVTLDSPAVVIFQKNQPMILSELQDDPRYYPVVSKHVSFKVNNLLGVPMRVKDKPNGVLEALNKHHGDFDESDADILSVIASQAAVAIHNAGLVKALQDAYNELRTADQLKGNFLALASHELRTPLGVIIGYATLLQEESQDELSEHARQVVNAAMQMRSLVDAMTNLNMLRANEMILHPQTFAIQKTLKAAYAEIKPLADTKNQQVTLQLSDQPLQVSGDPEKLTAAFVNLLNNAVRFTPEGGRIVLGARAEKEGVLAWVEDNGIGIPAGELKKIFQEFYQVEPHTTRKTGGMGIGLTIAKGLIEAHGGKIRAESPGPGKGATFKVALPAANRA
jgi:signal transduction histidine kinase